MSKERILIGATVDQSPSGACEISLSQATSTSTCALLLYSLGFLCFQAPGGSSIQLHPTTFASAMNRTSKSMLASKGLSRAGDHLTSPFSISLLAAATILEINVGLERPLKSRRPFNFTLLDKPPSCSHHLRDQCWPRKASQEPATI